MTSVQRRVGGAFGVSAVLHAGLAALAILFVGLRSQPVATQTPPVRLSVIYLPIKGVEAGGGGGSPVAAMAAALEVPRHEPPKPTPVTAVEATSEPPPQPELKLDAPIDTDSARLLAAGGGIVPIGGGGPSGADAGPSPGPGIGPGGPGGFGGGPAVPGGDVSYPTLVSSPPPRYTVAAMQAHIQGDVVIAAVVSADGTVGSVRVTRSLDPNLGLDAEALKAAKQWKFKPAMRRGEPVDVLVTLVLQFRLH